MKRVLITDGRAPLASHLVSQFLEQNIAVRQLVASAVGSRTVADDDPRVETVAIKEFSRSLNWAPLLDDVDIVVHNAELRPKKDITFERGYDSDMAMINFFSTLNLYKAAAAERVKKFVYIGSAKVNPGAAVLPPLEVQEPQTENNDVGTHTAYGFTKYLPEEYLARASVGTGMATTILLPATIVHGQEDTMWWHLLRLIERKIPLPIFDFNVPRSVISLQNLAHAVMASLKSEALYTRYLVADKFPISLAQIVDLLWKSMHAEPARWFRIRVRRLRNKFIKSERVQQLGRIFTPALLDTGKIKSELGWEPVYPIERAAQEIATQFVARRAESRRLSYALEQVKLWRGRGPAQRRIAFVTTWFGDDIGGGAEAECMGLVRYLAGHHASEFETHVLATTLKEFSADWNQPWHQTGVCLENGIKVFRFNPTIVNRDEFHPLNAFRLMPPRVDDLEEGDSPLTAHEEEIYRRSMIDSPGLRRFLMAHRWSYDAFIFIPYMFGPSFRGIPIVGKRSLLIPCLHNERYIFLNTIRQMVQKAGGLIFHMEEEQKLAQRTYKLAQKSQLLLGEMVDIDPPIGDPARFRETFGIKAPYFIYAGRKIVGKNLHVLVRQFSQIKAGGHVPSDVKLVVIGGGDLEFKETDFPDVIDLGFVTSSQKYDAISGAVALIQPSTNESFSIVMMEAWLQGRPVVVNSDCAVTVEHGVKSTAGYSYADTRQLAEVLSRLCADSALAADVGARGRRYVIENFSPTSVGDRFVKFLREFVA